MKMEIFVCNNNQASSDEWLFNKACKNALNIPDSIHYVVIELMLNAHYNKMVRKLSDMKAHYREWEDAIIDLPDTNSRIELCPLDYIKALPKTNKYKKQFVYFADFGHYPLDVIGFELGKVIIREVQYPIEQLTDIWLADGTKFFQRSTPYKVSAPFKTFSKINNGNITALKFNNIRKAILVLASSQSIVLRQDVNLKCCKQCAGCNCLRLGKKTIVSEFCPYYPELYLKSLKNENKV